MNRKISQTKKPTKKTSPKRSQYSFNLTRKELFLWLGVAFLVMVWMFTLGVIVGRGLSPVRFDVEKIKKELIALKEEALEKEERANSLGASSPSEERALGFYDALTDKKEEARLKSLPEAQQRSSSKPALQDKVPQKTSTVQKEKTKAKPSSTKEAPRAASFTVQAAALKDATRASGLASELKDKGYDAYVVKARVSGEGTYYRVRVGHFDNHREAIRMASRLTDEKLAPLIIRE